MIRSPHQSTPQPVARGWADGLLCAALVGVVLLVLVLHLPEVGFIDDFSYRETAIAFAQTGHWHYYLWSGVPLLAQALWAEPFIKLLGPMYLACRISTVVLMVLMTWNLHALLRRAGLNRSYAALGTLLVGLNPLSVTLACSFMTDTCALVLIMFGLYCAARLASAETRQAALGWLLLGFACSLVGSTERQTVVLIGAVTLPAVVLGSPFRKFLIGPTAVLWLVNVWAEVAVMRWFFHQPGGVNTTTMHGGVNWSAISHFLHAVVLASLWLLAFLLPAAVQTFADARRLTVKRWAAAGAVFCVSAAFVFFSCRHFGMPGVFPFLRGTTEVLLNDTVLSHRAVGYTLTLALLLCFSVAAVVMATEPKGGSRRPASGQELSVLQLSLVVGPFLAVYTGLIFFRSMWLWVFDRYMLPVSILILIFLLRWLQSRLPRLSWAPWAAVGLYAAFAVTVVRDWGAAANARAEAQARVVRAGISEFDVLAGIEIDAVKEFRLRGAVTDPGFNVIAYDTPPLPLKLGCTFLHPATMDVQPEYVLVGQTVGCEQPSSFGVVEYRAWLPPFRREVVIAKVEPAS